MELIDIPAYEFEIIHQGYSARASIFVAGFPIYDFSSTDSINEGIERVR